MPDTPHPTCARCGRAVDRTKENFRQAGADVIEHVVCPTSSALRSLPLAGAAERPQFLTMGEAARMLSVSGDTIRRRIRSGELPAKRLRGTAGGGRETILVEQRDVLALLEDYTGPEEGERDV